MIAIKQAGSAEHMRSVERDRPKRQAADLLIKVEAAGVNRPDIITRERQTDQPEAVRLGAEGAHLIPFAPTFIVIW